jgi:hypothetical protein
VRLEGDERVALADQKTCPLEEVSQFSARILTPMKTVKGIFAVAGVLLELVVGVDQSGIGPS